MATFIDKKYIGYISNSLERFSWKKETLANCRCPFCGDSGKNKSKARGYFFPYKDRWIFKCHNCGVSCGVYAVLKQVAPSLAKEYSLESFKESNGIQPEQSPPPAVKQPSKTRKVNPLEGLPRLVELNEHHPAVQYILNRGLPKECLAELMYAHDFTKVGKRLDPEYFPNTKREDPRIVIPFFDRSGTFIGVQGRTMNSQNSLRYVTLKPKGQQTKLWYGLWKVDATERVYVVEGPFDSMILPNAIAMVGANACDDLPDFLSHSDLVFVLDNEPRNSQIVSYMEELIDQGRKICVWPNGLAEKDINEMLSGKSAETIKGIIDTHTYTGLAARINLNRWRRV